MITIGIDLGGTNIAVATVNQTGNILSRANIPTPQELGTDSPKNIAESIKKACYLALEEGNIPFSDISSIGIAAPGIIDPHTQTIIRWSNFQFHHVPLGQIFQQSLAQDETTLPPIYMENDANAAALGEYFIGAGKNSQSLVAVTLGTGVGGGAVFADKLFTGFNHAAMEVGHFVIQNNGTPCTCGRNGCFEAYSSATALIKQTKKKMETLPKTSVLWQLAQENLNNVNGKLPFQAAQQGDPHGKEILDSYLKYLATGIINLINLLQPEILCIGGGIANQKENLLSPLLDIIQEEEYAKEMTQRCKVTLAQLGNDAGIIGAALAWKTK